MEMENEREVATIIVMGVSGCGKSTVGGRVAALRGAIFLDADDFHSEENRRKMKSGIPLTDSDRMPWLRSLRERILLCETAGIPLVVACSALRANYRRILDGNGRDRLLGWAWLDGPAELLANRMRQRGKHFMPETLLESQLATLEAPGEALRLSVENPPAALARHITEFFLTSSLPGKRAALPEKSV
jgi:gluconokinase